MRLPVDCRYVKLTAGCFWFQLSERLQESHIFQVTQSHSHTVTQSHSLTYHYRTASNSSSWRWIWVRAWSILYLTKSIIIPSSYLKTRTRQFPWGFRLFHISFKSGFHTTKKQQYWTERFSSEVSSTNVPQK